jgi:UPF0176 protein
MFIVAALYQFTKFNDPAVIKPALFNVAEAHGVKGTLLLAREGINGTIAGPRTGIDAVINHIKALPGCENLDWKESTATDMPFPRLKVRLKKEIVTMGQPDVDPTASVGTYVQPEDWNDLIASEDVVTIDTRNDYEVAIGTFDGAVDPDTQAFGEFPEWWHANKDKFEGKRIAMFCTGGIRCEKASNYLLGEGVEEVFHLKGGILKYLEHVPEEDSLWQGECFVFDGRVSVGHGLEEGTYDLCHACRQPLSDDEKRAVTYEAGVSCPKCFATTSEDAKTRFRERQKQIALAKARGQVHVGN